MNKLDDCPQYIMDDPLINISSTSIFAVDSSTYVPVLPIIGDFLLLDGTDFLLLDGTKLLLL